MRKKQIIIYIYCVCFGFSCLAQKKDSIDISSCQFLSEILNDKGLKAVLGFDSIALKQHNINIYNIAIRITDTKSELRCDVSVINKMTVITSNKIDYNFNTRIYREILVNFFKKIEDNKYHFSIIAYEFFCSGSNLDMYGVDFILEKDEKGNFFILSSSYGLAH